MKTIRTFIAIHLPEDVKSSLGQVSATLAARIPQRAVRWVAPNRLHLTLRFLGETDVTKLPAISGELDRVAARHTRFRLCLAQLGCFPNMKRPRVIWAGIQGDLPALRVLQKEIGDALIPLGWEREERPYQAHLTLGRVKDSRKLSGADWDADVEERPIPVNEVHLVESQLRPDGPLYSVRHTSRLKRS